MKAARTAINTALQEIITNVTIYKVIIATINIVRSLLIARVHRLVVKDKLGQVIGLFIEGNAYM
ncbi:hypothetical protein E2C01_080570 [Portunus trituberculatus]|uniref:Uncharacterized protein n=1 Tax=Portunus trituberculatus TaxID=210409 RepID=A0A5B7IWG8_PORTR|nr:hypothetical protein [Portunus trituberculatus]